MTHIVTIMFLFVFGNKVSGQAFPDSESWRQQVLTEVSCDEIEDLMLGCSTCISKHRLKADSLFNRISLDTALVYLKSNSYTVKYYSFLRTLALDDSSAFIYLKKNISDSTKLDIRGACMSRTVSFNKLIAAEYKQFIYFKYKGQSFTIDGRTYIFEKSDRKTGKYKAQEFKKLTTPYGFNTLG